jgi:hypothetical protein
MNKAKTAIAHAWNDIRSIHPQHAIPTPTGRSAFSLVRVESEQLTFATARSGATIFKEHFENALGYLMAQGHSVGSPCRIDSNKEYAKAGPLCRAARSTSRGRMNITYVLPILQEVGLVGINPARPSTAWFIA